MRLTRTAVAGHREGSAVQPARRSPANSLQVQAAAGETQSRSRKSQGSAIATGRQPLGGLPLPGKAATVLPASLRQGHSSRHRLKQPPEGGSDGSFYACHGRHERSCQVPRVLRQRAGAARVEAPEGFGRQGLVLGPVGRGIHGADPGRRQAGERRQWRHGQLRGAEPGSGRGLSQGGAGRRRHG